MRNVVKARNDKLRFQRIIENVIFNNIIKNYFMCKKCS